MIVRRVRQEEERRCHELFAAAFDQPMSPAAEEDAPGEPGRAVQRWAAFRDDGRTMMSTFVLTPFEVTFDGHAVPMMGVGGVATLPCFRKQGGIRGCFEHALPDLYRQGFLLSALYPFSDAFYRRFGYELGCACNEWRVKLSAIPAWEIPGSWVLLKPGEDLKDEIRAVNRRFEAMRNMMVHTVPADEAWIARANPFTDREYTYLYRSADGAPSAFVTWKPADEAEGRCLRCSRFVFTDAAGFRALLSLLRGLSADFAHARFLLPLDVEPGSLLPEWSFGSVLVTRHEWPMVRVIRAEDALRLLKPAGSGRCVLSLTDGQIPENCGRFAVDFRPDGDNAVTCTDEAPDADMTIAAFSRLAVGRGLPEEDGWLPGLAVHGRRDVLSLLFPRKPHFITAMF